MERRALVIDANILIRAVLGQRVRRMLAKSAPDANRAVPLSMSLFAPPPMTDDRRFAASRTVAWKPLPVDFIRLGVAFRVFSWDNYNHLGAKARSRRPAKDCSAQAFAPSYQIRPKKNNISSGSPRLHIGRLTIITFSHLNLPRPQQHTSSHYLKLSPQLLCR